VWLGIAIRNELKVLAVDLFAHMLRDLKKKSRPTVGPEAA
jgi:hypothetical protein